MTFANPNRILLATVAIAVAAIPFTGQADDCPDGIGAGCGDPQCFGNVASCCRWEPLYEKCKFYCTAECGEIGGTVPRCSASGCPCNEGFCTGTAHDPGDDGNWKTSGGVPCMESNRVVICTNMPCVNGDLIPGGRCSPQIPQCIPSAVGSSTSNTLKWEPTGTNCIESE